MYVFLSKKLTVNQMAQKKTRIAYLSGPVDARDVYKSWKYKKELPYFGTSYLSQFLDFCEEREAEGFIITSYAGQKYREKLGIFTILNKPSFSNLNGLKYHLGEVYWTLNCLLKILKFRPDLVIVTAAQNYWFCLKPLFWADIPVLPAVHCTHFAKFSPNKMHQKLLWFLNRKLFWQRVIAAMGVSSDIAQELRQLTNKPVYTFVPTYRRQDFDQLDRPVHSTPFRIFFAGRIEENKGVFDLLEMASALETETPGGFIFDVCGDGGAIRQLRQANKLPNFHIHGVCNPAQLLELLSRSCAVVVPTKSSFEEGFNKVCAEAILASRPLITSAACPALHTVKSAAIEVKVDDVADYIKAIKNLQADPDLYESKVDACDDLKKQFYDEKRSWHHVLRKIVHQHSSVF